MNIKLPVPITDAKTMLSFSILHYRRKNYFINGLLFRDHVLKFQDFFATFSAPNS